MSSPYSSNPYINWLAKRLADPSTSTRDYVNLRAEWDNIVFLQNQVNHLVMQKRSRSPVYPRAVTYPDFADTTQIMDDQPRGE